MLKMQNLAGTALAAALLANLGASPAQAQQSSSRQMSWAADEVFQALNNARGTEAYYDAMEAATDELHRAGIISNQVERFYDRRESRSDWNWGDDRLAFVARYHDEVMNALRRSRGTPGYYQAMEAAADELEGEDLISDAAEEYFDRMSRGTYGAYGEGYGWRAGPFGYGPNMSRPYAYGPQGNAPATGGDR